MSGRLKVEISVELAEAWAARAGAAEDAQTVILRALWDALRERGEEELATAVQAAILVGIGGHLSSVLATEARIVRIVDEKMRARRAEREGIL